VGKRGGGCVEAIRNELRSAGVRAYKTEVLGSGHVRITWFTVNGKRSVVTTGTRSDFRASRNVRATTRRLLRQDALLSD